MANPVRRAMELLEEMGPREKRAWLLIGERMLAGQKLYGELTPRKKKWAKEAAEEAFDGTVYLSALLVDLADEEDGTD